jgi:hypothetical protein
MSSTFSSLLGVIFLPLVADAKDLFRASVRQLLCFAYYHCGVCVWKASAHSGLLTQVASLISENEKIKKQLDFLQHNEEDARAQLMQLRVYQAEEHHRLGFMVSAFIPEEVCFKMRDASEERKQAFIRNIAEVQVKYAVDGIFHLTKHGKCQALMFEPVYRRGKQGRVVSPVFETEKGRTKIL